MKTIRKYYGRIIVLAYISVIAVIAYIPYTYARPAVWINPNFSGGEIPSKTDPWEEKQKELQKERDNLKKLKGKNI